MRNIIAKLKTKQLLDKLKTTKDPMEAYAILEEYLEDDISSSSKFKYKGCVVECAFEFIKADKHNDSSIWMNLVIESNSEEVLSLKLRLTQVNITNVYNMVMSLVNKI